MKNAFLFVFLMAALTCAAQTASRPTCKGTTAAGSPCKSTFVIKGTGFCRHHQSGKVGKVAKIAQACKAVAKSSGQPCKVRHHNQNGYCRFHQPTATK